MHIGQKKSKELSVKNAGGVVVVNVCINGPRSDISLCHLYNVVQSKESQNLLH